MARRSNGTRSARTSAPRDHPTWLGAGLAAALLTLLLGGGVAAQEDHASHNAATFAAHDHSFDGPSELAAGWQDITLANLGAETHHLQFARLNDGVTP